MKRATVMLMLALYAAPGLAEADGGAVVFARWCAACHGDTPAAPGRLKLAWSRGVELSILTARPDLSAATVRRVVRQGQAEMPAFRKTEISDLELALLVRFLTDER